MAAFEGDSASHRVVEVDGGVEGVDVYDTDTKFNPFLVWE